MNFPKSVALSMSSKLMILIGITEAYKADSFPEKINLGVGAYRMTLYPCPDLRIEICDRRR